MDVQWSIIKEETAGNINNNNNNNREKSSKQMTQKESSMGYNLFLNTLFLYLPACLYVFL